MSLVKWGLKLLFKLKAASCQNKERIKVIIILETCENYESQQNGDTENASRMAKDIRPSRKSVLSVRCFI